MSKCPHLVSPGEEPVLLARPARHLPLRLRGQPLARPLAEGHRVIPGDVNLEHCENITLNTLLGITYHGMGRATCEVRVRTLGMAPVRARHLKYCLVRMVGNRCFGLSKTGRQDYYREPPWSVGHSLFDLVQQVLGEEELGHEGVTELLCLGDVAGVRHEQLELAVGHLVDV